MRCEKVCFASWWHLAIPSAIANLFAIQGKKALSEGTFVSWCSQNHKQTSLFRKIKGFMTINQISFLEKLILQLIYLKWNYFSLMRNKKTFHMFVISFVRWGWKWRLTHLWRKVDAYPLSVAFSRPRPIGHTRS